MFLQIRGEVGLSEGWGNLKTPGPSGPGVFRSYELFYFLLLLPRERHALILWLKERNGERV
jgi:hypothetical protein